MILLSFARYQYLLLNTWDITDNDARKNEKKIIFPKESFFQEGDIDETGLLIGLVVPSDLYR
jgi:hypothetical protein